MEPRKAVGILAGVVLLIGIVLLLVPTSVDNGDVGCGSALSPSTSEASAAEFGNAVSDIYRGGDGSDDGGYTALCEDRVGTQRLIAWPVVALAALVGGFLLLTTSGKPVAPARDENTDSTV